MNVTGEVLMAANVSTKPPRHMKKGNGKPGQKFSIERLEKLCDRYGIDPAEVAVEGLDRELTPDLKDKERIDIALRLMEYTYAKRKAVEVNGGDQPIELVVRWANEKSSK